MTFPRWPQIVACAFLAAAGVVGCSRDDAASQGPKVRTLGGRPPTGPAPAAAQPPVQAGESPPGQPPAHVPFASSDAGPITYTVTLKPDSAPPKVDPDLAILGAARSMGAACFTSIRDGSPTRSATIHVTVLPTGTVSRSEVSSNSTTEAWVLSCLESVGKNLHFADRPAGDLRTYDVDVTVVRNH